MLAAMARHAPSDLSLRDKVYESLREALTAGRFLPGQKLTFRFVAGTLGVSLTPVREAIRRLAAEGAFEMQPNRSVRLPLLTRDRVLELRDIRMASRASPPRRPAPGQRRVAFHSCAGSRLRSWPSAAATTRPTGRRFASSTSRSMEWRANRP
jgi:DNA-binding transcriptional MocR family regulator